MNVYKLRDLDMFGRFKIKGARPYIRLDEELELIDKKAADAAFKACKKRILDEYLCSKGFIKYKSNSYIRRNGIDVLEYIDLQKERYGSKTFTVNYAMLPLYVPHDFFGIGFGGRVGELINGKSIWWDYADEEIAEISFQNVVSAIERLILPWFERYSDEQELMKKLLKDRETSEKTRIGTGYRNREWIKALEEKGDYREIVVLNCENLKLPKKLM